MIDRRRILYKYARTLLEVGEIMAPRGFVAFLAICLAMLFAMHQPSSAVEVKTGPLWHDLDARMQCPRVCKGDGREWTGKWRTLELGKTSACECSRSGQSRGGGDHRQGRKVSLDTGPIWNNFDAQRKCPGVCSAERGSRWDGNWRTTRPGRTSQCDCVRR